MDYLLHPENFALMPWRGRLIKRQINRRAAEVSEATRHKTDPAISVVIRSKNDAADMKILFADLAAQEYDGKIEVIVVDTESSDGTAEYARSQGARVISISQAEFTYPKALNIGLRAAKHPYVAVLVGHSSLSNRFYLKALTYWKDTENFGGVYHLPLASPVASWIERWAYLFGLYGAWKQPLRIEKAVAGVLGANCSIIKRSVWQDLGGYDEKFAGGGEDLELARRMLAQGLQIIREPLCSPFHAHGLGVIDSIKQMHHWRQIAGSQPRPFDTDKIHARRPDLRQKNGR